MFAGMAPLGLVAAVMRAMEGAAAAVPDAPAERALVHASFVQGKQQATAGRRGGLLSRWVTRRNSQAALSGVRAAAIDGRPAPAATPASVARRAAVRDRIDDVESALRERHSAGGAAFELSGPDVGRERLSERALAAVSC